MASDVKAFAALTWIPACAGMTTRPQGLNCCHSCGVRTPPLLATFVTPAEAGVHSSYGVRPGRCAFHLPPRQTSDIRPPTRKGIHSAHMDTCLRSSDSVSTRYSAFTLVPPAPKPTATTLRYSASPQYVAYSAGKHCFAVAPGY